MGSCGCCELSTRCQICLGLGLLVAVTVVTVVGVLKWRPSPQPLEWNGTRTTPHFPEIFLGRCYSYTRVLRPGLGNPDCISIMNAFKRAFISKNPCNITEEDYGPLLELDNQTVPCDKTLFWSKLSSLAHQYTQIEPGMFTLEDSLLGYMADGLSWCGDPNTSEMNEHSCPHWRLNCPNNPVSVFWKVLSRKFAEAACGVVQVMLNGSHPTPFDKSSTFGSVEIPHLNSSKVHTLQAWVMGDLGISSSDPCSHPSINELKILVTQKRISFVCQKNYRPARLIQCVKQPENFSCK